MVNLLNGKLGIYSQSNTTFSLGNVYNVTAYMDYHPGGWDELIKGAGRDATDLFNDAHR